jgi:NAD(P)-dependent dehydrogenase (short-subunit alcohol dehydrogenase family)
MNGNLDFDIKDKVAIFAGGGASGQNIGNGRAASILLVEAGAKVIVADKDELLTKNTVEMIKDRGGEATSNGGDLTKPDQCKKIVDLALNNWGRIDILDNNIGIASR